MANFSKRGINLKIFSKKSLNTFNLRTTIDHFLRHKNNVARCIYHFGAFSTMQDFKSNFLSCVSLPRRSLPTNQMNSKNLSIDFTMQHQSNTQISRKTAMIQTSKETAWNTLQNVWLILNPQRCRSFVWNIINS